MKIFNIKKIGHEKEICFFGVPLLRISQFVNADYTKKRINLFPQSFEKESLNEIARQIPQKHDGVFLLRAGMGESYLFCYAYEQLVRRFKFKNPCVVCHRAQYRDLVELFNNNICFYPIKIDPVKMFQSITNKSIKHRNFHFIIIPSCLWELQKLLTSYEEEKEKNHYANIIKNFMSIQEFEFKSPIIHKSIKEKAFSKVRDLNKENFIFFIPDANFIKTLPDDFWKILEYKLMQKGYDIYYNSQFLTIQESFYIASRSKGIIGLRCGFSEVLSILPIQKHIIYTPCKHNNLSNMINIFSLKKYPFVQVDTINEYDTMYESKEIIYNHIMRSF